MLAYSDSSYRQNDKDCMDIIIHYEDTETPLSCFSVPKIIQFHFPPQKECLKIIRFSPSKNVLTKF